MTDDLVKRLADIDPILDAEFDTQLNVRRDPYGATRAIEMALYLLRDQADRIEALTAERDRAIDDARDNAEYVDLVSQYRAERDAAKADNARLRDEIAHLKSEDGYIQAFIEGQKAMPKGVFTIVDSPELATIQADNARLREALTVDPWGLGWRKWQAHAATVLNLSPREETK
jgi:hypothetical protein